MEGGRVYAASNTAVLLPCSSDSLWISKSSPLQGDSVSGSKSMVNFEISPGEDKEDNGDDNYDRCFQQPGKKRRLRMDQVKFLERSFEVDNKLEPNRKVNLAKQLGLEPRQVSIWFQNRRARYKTKQLEKDYGSLKASYDKLKADHDGLLKQNEKLKREVHLVSEKLLVKEKGEEMSACDPINSSDVEPQIQIPGTISQDVTNVSMVVCKQEEANSSDSSRIFEPDQSDFSQDEEDNLSRSFLTLPCFPKIEDECCDDFNLGYPVEDQSFWFWSY